MRTKNEIVCMMNKKSPPQPPSKPEITRPAFRYFGSKWLYAPWIIENLPPHTVYVEPFGGGGNVMLRKNPSKLEVYNDLDSGVVNFWQILRNHTDELIRRIKLTPWSREEYYRAWEVSEDMIEEARRFYVRAWMSFTGEPSCQSGWRKAKSDKNIKCGTTILWGSEERLLAVAQRWREVQIEHDDAMKVIQHYDGPNTVFYCDPPYPHNTRSSRSSYRCEMGSEQHIELLKLLNTIQGKALISTYSNPIYDKHLPAKRWRRLERTSRTLDPRTNRIELLFIKK